MSAYVTIRIRESGQVTEMVPDVARALLASGMAEEVNRPAMNKPALPPRPESMTAARGAEHAVAPAQAGPLKKLVQRVTKKRRR